MTKQELQELQELRKELKELRLAVGYLGTAIYRVGGHRMPMELRAAVDAWGSHAAATAPPLGPNERRIGATPVTNASVDRDLAASR
jgi:hypothetical protein